MALSNCMFYLRLFVDNPTYRLEAYWSRCQMGIRRVVDDKHTWLGTHSNMQKNIEAANFVEPLQHVI